MRYFTLLVILSVNGLSPALRGEDAGTHKPIERGGYPRLFYPGVSPATVSCVVSDADPDYRKCTEVCFNKALDELVRKSNEDLSALKNLSGERIADHGKALRASLESLGTPKKKTDSVICRDDCTKSYLKRELKKLE